jgi:mRNA interferase RelE/StbE
MTYTVQILPAVMKTLRKLPKEVQARILLAVWKLEENPHPSGSVKIAGSTNDWRIRVGDYRVIYDIRDAELVVVVVDVGHRREVYRNY